MGKMLLNKKEKQEKIYKLNKHRYALVGGHKNLYTKLRGIVNRITHIEAENKKFCIERLRTVDYVIFCYDYLSHNVAKKIYNSNLRNRMIYIKGTNIEQIIDIVYSVVH